MNKEIEDLVTAYAQSFTDPVWTGEHPYIWPGVAKLGPRFHEWREGMMLIRKDFDYVISQLKVIKDSNARLQDDIDASKQLLYNFLAIEDSKKAVRQAEKLKVLTIAATIFIPLTFATSVCICPRPHPAITDIK